MDIEKMIDELPQESLKALKHRLANANRILARDPEHVSASKLRSAIKAELTQRMKANRRKVGQLWWEPHDADVPEFLAYEAAESTIPVAAIFKSDTHTATRKEVYAVRVGEHELAERFSEVALARKAGSDAWENSKR